MAAPTFNQLMERKVIRRGDKGMLIRLEDIHARDGFNPREEGERLHQSIEDDAVFTLNNGIENMPQLKVEPREEGGVWVNDGHRRRRIVLRAIELGADLEDKKVGGVWLPVKPWSGDDLARDAEIVSSQNGLKLTPYETMIVFERMAQKGASPDEIAKRTGCSRQYVDQLLKLAEGGDDVHAMVRAGQVSADIASDMVRKHGDQAVTELSKELEKAQALGKARITKGSIKGKSLPSAVVADITRRVKRVVQSIPPETRSILDQYRTQAITDGDTPVSIPVRELLALVMCAGHIDDVRSEQERKLKAKADKAVRSATVAMEVEHGSAE